MRWWRGLSSTVAWAHQGEAARSVRARSAVSPAAVVARVGAGSHLETVRASDISGPRCRPRRSAYTDRGFTRPAPTNPTTSTSTYLHLEPRLGPRTRRGPRERIAGPEDRGLVRTRLEGREGRIWVSESFNGVYHVFDSTGVFTATVPRPMRRIPPKAPPLLFDSAGRIIDVELRSSHLSVVRVDSATGRILARGPSAPVPEPPPAFGGVLPPNSAERTVAVHLLNRPKWALTRDGSLWSANSSDSLITLKSPNGQVIRRVRLRKTGGFTREERNVIERARREMNVGSVGAVPQQIQSILPMDDGKVLIQIPGSLGRPGREFALFDETGSWRGGVHAPFSLHPRATAALVGDTVIGIGLGELDAPLVVWAVLAAAR